MSPRLATHHFQAAHEDIVTAAADEGNILVVTYAVLSWGGSVRELVQEFVRSCWRYFDALWRRCLT